MAGIQELVEPVLALRGITKRFPGVVANDHIDFDLEEGEVHGLLGENGAGKSTLMNIVYGLCEMDEGEIFVRGKKVEINSPRDAIKLGIGMVHQNFMLFPSQTVVENVILGIKPARWPLLDIRSTEEEIRGLSEKYGFKVDPKARIWQLSVGEQQQVEILKALHRGVRILFLDEPTSVVTPQESVKLFQTLRSMADHGNSIVFISHKLREVMSICDRSTVLRNGKVIATVSTKGANERDLANMMASREVLLRIEKKPVEMGLTMLEIKDLWALNDRGLPALRGLSLSVRQGEILGIAGVVGNGQQELAEVIMGLRKAVKGEISLNGKVMTNRKPREILREGVSHIPVDKMSKGLIREFSVADNIILKEFDSAKFGEGIGLDEKKIETFSQNLISEYEVRTPGTSSPIKNLSGGNVQRLILARELSTNPSVLVADQPTQGLDVGVTEYIRKKLLEQRERKAAILLISSDLDELLGLSDRLAVMFEGKIVGVVSTPDANITDIGLMMAGSKTMEEEA
ncbi:MAG TPA: ABC transporter ATP-binding protein [Candidatus Bathyarchaeia archaeon]|nr:ABC transporter ATP-binding protein [Candidatus Bathyarchaeia archaeon]